MEKIQKNKNFILMCGGALLVVVLVGIISYSVGNSAKVSEMAISNTMNQIEEKSGELKTLDEKINSQKGIVSEIEEYKSTKEAKTSEIANLDNEIQDKNNTIASLDASISAKSSELDSLKNAIQRTGEEPKTLPAGEFTVGADLPEGRYQVSGSSNFVVYSSSGGLKVNTILGNSRVGSGDYVCTLSSGNTMRLSARTTFTPIK